MEEIIQNILSTLVTQMGCPFAKIEVETEENEEKTYRINIETDEPGVLIGHHGETIYALQNILKIILWKKKRKKEEFKITLDVDNYRKRQEENVIGLAERKADLVLKMKREQILPPMSPYFRRIVHLHLAQPEFKDVKTESIGEGDHRQIVIRLAES